MLFELFKVCGLRLISITSGGFKPLGDVLNEIFFNDRTKECIRHFTNNDILIASLIEFPFQLVI